MNDKKNTQHSQNYMMAVKEYIHPVDTTIPIDATVEEALEILRTRKISHQTQYIYAVNSNLQLQGVLSTRSLLFARKDEKIEKLVKTNVLTVYEEEKIEDVLHVLVQNQLLALPVINSSHCIVGIFEIIPYMALQESSFSNATSSDIFQLIGLSLEQKKIESPIASFKHRLPWLFCNVFGGLTCAFIASFFHLVLDIFVVLSLFIPLVLTLSESVSMQSTTICLQFLHFKEFPWKKVRKQIKTELQSATLLGLCCALIVCACTALYVQETAILLVVGISIFVAMLCGVLFGTITPIFLHVLRLDPKIAAGPAVLMLTDIAATGIYLSTATALLV